MSETSKQLGTLPKRLAAVGRRAQRVNRAAFLAVLASGLLLSLFAYFLLDYLTRFPGAVRLATTLALLGVFAVWLPRRYRRYLSKVSDPVALARAVERRAREGDAGSFGSVLVSALEFGLRPDIGGSGELKNRTMSSAQKADYNPLRVPLHDTGLTKLARRLVPAAGAVLLLWAIVGPNALATFLARSVGLSSAYLTRTNILSVEYPEVSPLNEPVEIVVKAGGDVPAGGRLQIQFEGEAVFDLELISNGEAGCHARVASPAKSFRFDVYLGDAESRGNRVRVVRPPFVQEGRVRIEPPAYTGIEAREHAIANFDVPEQSRFSISVKPDRPVASCELDLVDKRFALKAGQDGTFQLSGIRLHQDKAYSIRLVDADGIENRERVFYRMSVVRDQLPSLSLERPGNDGYWAPISRLRWRLDAADDYGMDAVRLRCQIAEATATGERILRTIDRELPALAGRRESSLTGVLSLMEFGIQPGQLLLVSAMVRDTCDFREDDDAWSASEVRRVRVVSVEDLRRIIEEEEELSVKMVNDLAEDVAREVKILQMRERLTR